MMQPSVIGHIVNYLNSLIPIRQFVPIRECTEFSQSCTRVREFISGLVTIRRDHCEQGYVKEDENRDALQCLLEYSDPSWNDKSIVEYVSRLLLDVVSELTFR
jgi:hypothetical protein